MATHIEGSSATDSGNFLTVQLFSYIPVYILPNFSVIRSIFLLLTKYFKFHFFYLAVSLKQAVRSYASNNLAI